MKRRALTTLLGACATGLAGLRHGLAQAGPRADGVRRIGWLSMQREDSDEALRGRRLLHESLRRAGYDEGRNLFVERRYAEGDASRLPALAQELAGADVDLIIAVTNAPIAAAHRVTRRIPIVMLGGVAPQDMGLAGGVTRLAPNVTGIASPGPERAARLLRLLQEAAPGVRRVALLLNPGAAGAARHGPAMERAALGQGLQLEIFEVGRPQDIGPVLQRLGARRPDALLVIGDPVVDSRVAEVAAFARRHRLVSIGSTRQFVEGGGLLYSGPDTATLIERTVGYVDRILQGARPQDLALEPPEKFELIVHLGVAAQLGLTLPRPLLQRATEIIE